MRSTTRQVIPRYILVATVLVALGCDPGYRFRPVTWIEQPERQWSHDSDGFSLRTHYLHGLVGEWWLATTFEVFGNSEIPHFWYGSKYTIYYDPEGSKYGP